MHYLEITLLGSDQKTHALKDFSGKKLLLYFYPKDNTSGCTIQAKDFTAYRSDFEAKGYKVIGVSRDSIRSHENFIQKQDLDLLLLSDPDEVLIKAFDVLKEKQMYGKKYLGIERSTFLIDEQGKIVKAYRGVSAKGHAEQLLSEL
ncbi:MAG: peroxiredoxin [Candidatus Izemoplasmataceae bacterium]